MVEKIASNCILNTKVVIKNKNKALKEVKKDRTNLSLQIDGSKLNQDNVAAAVC